MQFQKTFILTVLFLLLLGCTKNFNNTKEENLMPNFITTEDGVKIAYDLYPSAKENPSVILLHMLDRNKNDYADLAKELQKDYNLIAIDFRGHGESDGKWQKFNANDFISMEKDVKSAKEFLKSQGYNAKQIGIIGASIGANTALNYGTNDSDVKVVVLLSPGIEYRWIRTETFASKYNKKMLIITAEEDAYSAESSRKIFKLSHSEKELKIYDGIEHGTRMLGAKKDIFGLIKKWLDKGLK